MMGDQSKDAIEEVKFAYVIKFVFKKLILWHHCAECEEKLSVSDDSVFDTIYSFVG